LLNTRISRTYIKVVQRAVNGQCLGFRHDYSDKKGTRDATYKLNE